MTCSNCDEVQIEYTGNGSQVDYTFPFEYNNESDIRVAFWNEAEFSWEDTTEWVLLNATTIRFNEAPEDNQRILIYRCSGIDPLPATFYPGTSIKAQDLNENFFVLKNAVEEAKCEASKKSLDSNTLVTELETINGEWVDGDLNTDSRVPTAAATSERLDPIFEDLLPDPQNWRLPGRRWFDADSTKTRVWDQVNGVWVEAAASGVPGPPGPAFYNFVDPVVYDDNSNEVSFDIQNLSSLP